MKQIQPMESVEELNVYRLLRIARNIKAKDLAAELSISPAYVNAIEKGERIPSDRLRRDYAIALGVDEEVFSTFIPENQKNKRFENILLSLLQMICKSEE